MSKFKFIYCLFTIVLARTYHCNAMLPLLGTIGQHATAISGIMVVGKPIAKELEHIFGHHHRHQQVPPAAAPINPEQQSFLQITQKKIVEKSSDAISDAVAEGLSIALRAMTVSTVQAFTQKQEPVIQMIATPAPQETQSLAIQQKYHRHYALSSSEESSSSSSESYSSSSSDSDTGHRRTHRRIRYKHCTHRPCHNHRR
jgi:hypothetical protein